MPGTVGPIILAILARGLNLATLGKTGRFRWLGGAILVSQKYPEISRFAVVSGFAMCSQKHLLLSKTEN